MRANYGAAQHDWEFTQDLPVTRIITPTGIVETYEAHGVFLIAHAKGFARGVAYAAETCTKPEICTCSCGVTARQGMPL